MGKAPGQEGAQRESSLWGCPPTELYIQKPTQEAGLRETERRKADSRTALELPVHMDRGSGVLGQSPESLCPHMDTCAHVGPQIGSPGGSESQNDLL